MKQGFKVVKHKVTGSRFIRLEDGTVIPAEIAALAAGPDKWLSEIECKCRDCSQLFALRDLVSGLYCENCVAEGIEG